MHSEMKGSAYGTDKIGTDKMTATYRHTDLFRHTQHYICTASTDEVWG